MEDAAMSLEVRSVASADAFTRFCAARQNYPPPGLG